MPDQELLTSLLGREVRGLAPLADLLESSEVDLVARGLLPDEARRIAVVAEIARRHQPADGESRVLDPGQAVRLLARLRSSPLAQVALLLLDADLRVIGDHLVVGDPHRHEQSPAALLDVARERRAAAVVVAHNHPDGTRLVTEEDVAFSHGLRSAGRRRGVEVVDHLIVGPRAWVSHRQLGLLP